MASAIILRNADGSPLQLSDLPSPGERVRWTINRKWQLLTAVKGGLLTMADARERYALTVEELEEWSALYQAGGFAALRTTKLGVYRYGSDA